MSVVVTLRDIVFEMTEVGDDQAVFLNRNTGELLCLTDEQRYALENNKPAALPDEQRALQEAIETGDLLELPSAFEHHEYSIVEQFCHSVKDADQRDELLAAIRGKRAFRDFTATVRRIGLEAAWLNFHERALEEIVVRWLEANNVSYQRAA
jgi:hypothetical protein